jgi:CO/xanthine dehydrogenase Mo-binding subunit
MSDAWSTVDEAARELSIDPDEVRRLIMKDRLLKIILD